MCTTPQRQSLFTFVPESLTSVIRHLLISGRHGRQIAVAVAVAVGGGDDSYARLSMSAERPGPALPGFSCKVSSAKLILTLKNRKLIHFGFLLRGFVEKEWIHDTRIYS